MSTSQNEEAGRAAPVEATTLHSDAERLLTTREAARFLGVSHQFLEKDRSVGRTSGDGCRIPYATIGRAVRYRRADLDDFVERNLRRT